MVGNAAPSGETEGPGRSEGDVQPGSFPRSIRSEGVSRPPSIWEIETHREHIRLNLENWEKQWVDVLRYERAKVEDDANQAAIRRALARSGASLAMALSALVPVVSDAATLEAVELGPTNLAGTLIAIGSTSIMLSLASLWYAGHVWNLRRRFAKSRTRPLLPPERLDARELLASLEHLGDPLYYRERDADPELGFGWKPGLASPPLPADE